MRIDEKQTTFLEERITSLKSTLEVLYGNISRVKGEIFAYENPNTLFNHARQRSSLSTWTYQKLILSFTKSI
jgi:hypothetical protein